VDFLPEDFHLDGLHDDDDVDVEGSLGSERSRQKQAQLLDAIIGSPLSLLLQSEAVDKVRSVVQGGAAAASSPTDITGDTGIPESSNPPPDKVQGTTLISPNSNSSAVRTFLVRTQGALSLGRRSCIITQSGAHFLLEIEDQQQHQEENSSPDVNPTSLDDQEETMLFMQSIAHELQKCWSIEEMAGLVCSRIMSETPYDRGMVRSGSYWGGTYNVVTVSMHACFLCQIQLTIWLLCSQWVLCAGCCYV
jgi:hypothetical protein